jgi:hypothetical protein
MLKGRIHIKGESFRGALEFFSQKEVEMQPMDKRVSLSLVSGWTGLKPTARQTSLLDGLKMKLVIKQETHEHCVSDFGF